jgi:putative chitinase
MNRRAFFDIVRARLFNGALTADQVEGLNRYLDAMLAARWPLAWASYGLATGYHETAFTMQPVAERGDRAYFMRQYDITGRRPAYAAKMGNTTPGDGFFYRGRGDVQLTWKVNYRRAGDKLGVDLVRYPDMAMDPALSIRIMIAGMEEGWFTGKRNRDYLNSTPPDYREARRIINGTDKAATIAGHARNFEAALRAGGYEEAVATANTRAPAAPKAPPAPANGPPAAARPLAPVLPPPDIPKPASPQPATASGGLLSRIFARLTRRTAA